MPKLKVAASIPVTRSDSARKTLLLRTLLLSGLSLLVGASPALAQDISADEAPISVLSYKWSKDRRAMELVDTSGPSSPQPAMIPQNKNFERQKRVNDPAGTRDPNADTLDGRSAELDRITAQARETKPQTEGFTYQTKVQNNSAKPVALVFWEYQFREKGNPTILSRRQFVCLAKLKPAKARDLEIFTLAAPSSVISVKSLSKKSEPTFDEAVIINRVEFEDGSTWQRKDWNYDDVKLTARPAGDPKKLQMCRGL
ncbi:MAG TPA: hypothetical protein VJS64_20045 [Pyrinomonadaceae bacterium]|nr:hypothetical protein [Pyrinomonadaceae bacterium]